MAAFSPHPPRKRGALSGYEPITGAHPMASPIPNDFPQAPPTKTNSLGTGLQHAPPLDPKHATHPRPSGASACPGHHSVASSRQAFCGAGSRAAFSSCPPRPLTTPASALQALGRAHIPVGLGAIAASPAGSARAMRSGAGDLAASVLPLRLPPSRAAPQRLV